MESFLDFHRGVIVRKVIDLPLSAAATQLVPSRTTLAGLLRHLTVVEREWFQTVLSEHPPAAEPSTPRADASWAITDADTVADLRDAYVEECARSRAAVATHELSHVVRHPVLGEVSLRWIYVHMIEETARHAGQADILRELTDGATGVT
jgi:uncharacterized damage-inducible protein DinB